MPVNVLESISWNEAVMMLIIFFCTVMPIFHMLNAFPIIRKRKMYKAQSATVQRKISVIIPCYNEALAVKSTIGGLNKVNYDHVEYIFINDGSTDDTMESLSRYLKLKVTNRKGQNQLAYQSIRNVYQSTLYQSIFVIDKMNGGKADALNAGCDFADGEIIVTLDADSILSEDALSIINTAFSDQNVIAAGGMVHTLQGNQYNSRTVSFNNRFIVRFQIVEYLKSFYVYKASLARLNALAIISGAFGAFNRRILLQLGGYSKTIGEDIDITMKFQQYRYKHPQCKIVLVPNAICYTEVPENWDDLFKQRVRWQKAFLDCIVKYFPFLMKTLFTRSLSFFFIVDGLLVGTLASIFTIINLIFSPYFRDPWTSIRLVELYVVCSLMLNFFYTYVALFISHRFKFKVRNREKYIMLLTVFLDLCFYRFITVLFLIYGSFAYFFNSKDWNKVQRTGKYYLKKDGSDAVLKKEASVS